MRPRVNDYTNQNPGSALCTKQRMQDPGWIVSARGLHCVGYERVHETPCNNCTIQNPGSVLCTKQRMQDPGWISDPCIVNTKKPLLCKLKSLHFL